MTFSNEVKEKCLGKVNRMVFLTIARVLAFVKWPTKGLYIPPTPHLKLSQKHMGTDIYGHVLVQEQGKVNKVDTFSVLLFL